MIGQTFSNGVDGPHAVSFNWAETLTVVRVDQGYSPRLVVRDRYGRHGYAHRGLK